MKGGTVSERSQGEANVHVLEGRSRRKEGLWCRERPRRGTALHVDRTTTTTMVNRGATVLRKFMLVRRGWTVRQNCAAPIGPKETESTIHTWDLGHCCAR